jgi:hypothetical protein
VKSTTTRSADDAAALSMADPTIGGSLVESCRDIACVGGTRRTSVGFQRVRTVPEGLGEDRDRRGLGEFCEGAESGLSRCQGWSQALTQMRSAEMPARHRSAKEPLRVTM